MDMEIHTHTQTHTQIIKHSNNANNELFLTLSHAHNSELLESMPNAYIVKCTPFFPIHSSIVPKMSKLNS